MGLLFLSLLHSPTFVSVKKIIVSSVHLCQPPSPVTLYFVCVCSRPSQCTMGIYFWKLLATQPWRSTQYQQEVCLNTVLCCVISTLPLTMAVFKRPGRQRLEGELPLVGLKRASLLKRLTASRAY